MGLGGIQIVGRNAAAKHDETEYAASVARHRHYNLLNWIPQIVWHAAPDGYGLYLNRRWYEFTGHVVGSDLGFGWLEAIHPEDQASTLTAWQSATATARDLSTMFRLRTRDGDYRWVSAQASPRLSEKGDVIDWFGTCTDAHERVLAELALHEDQHRTKSTLDSLPQVVWTAGPFGSPEWANEQWYRWHGTDLSPANWWAAIHPADGASASAAWRSCIRSGEPYENESRMRMASGEYRWMLIRASPERASSGRVVRWYGTCTDVHDRVLAEEALRKAVGLNRTILDSSPDCIKLMKQDGTILYLNPLGPAALEIDDPAPLLGACWFDLLSEENRQTARDAVQSAAAGQNSQFVALQPTAKGRGKWFHIMATAADEPGADARVVVVARDITEQKAAEQALRDSEALYRGMMEASADCIKIVGQDGTLELMNSPGLSAMEFEDFAQVRGQQWCELWPQNARPKVSAALEEARSGKTARFTDFCPTAKGTPKWWDVVVTPMTSESGDVVRLLCISRDITSTREAADRLRWTSEHDALTDLPNRRSFQTHLQAATLRAMESGGLLGLLLIDLDHFKHVNDTLGHAAGDHLLKTFGQRLKAAVRSTDVIARLGGDEFAVILEGVKAQDDLLSLGQAILNRLSAPITFDGRVISAGASIGGALFPSDATSANDLFKCADSALYALKDSGRGGTRLFHNYMREHAQKIASQLSLARVALSEESVVPHYQQKVELQTGKIRGFEALLRWKHPTLGMQQPDTVAEAFKDYELASKIGELMQRKVFSDMRSWQRAGIDFGRVSINASPAEFLRDDYAEKLLSRAAEYQIPGELIEVEVTEHVFLERGAEYVSRALTILHEADVRLSLDDFGTGYSSLSHLRDFPVDVVKIDRSFIAQMLNEPEIASIVSAVIDLAASLKLDVVAEGIETPEQEAALRGKACGLGQGYWFGRAVVGDEVPILLQR